MNNAYVVKYRVIFQDETAPTDWIIEGFTYDEAAALAHVEQQKEHEKTLTNRRYEYELEKVYRL
jgi:maltooligosyltrehalose synthase